MDSVRLTIGDGLRSLGFALAMMSCENRSGDA